MIDFTQGKVKEYIDSGGLKCPHCGVEGDQIGLSTDFEHQIYRRWLCQNCGKKWVETFKLVDVHPLV